MALELTPVLLVAAAVLFFVLRARRKAGVDKAAEAARKAVQGRVGRDTSDKATRRNPHADTSPLRGED